MAALRRLARVAAPVGVAGGVYMLTRTMSSHAAHERGERYFDY